MRAFIRLFRVGSLSALVCAALAMGVSSSAAAEDTVSAVWQVQEIYFPYFGLTTLYSCDGIRDKVRQILLQLQVRQDLMVSVAGCTEISGPVRSPSVRIVVANPVVASDATRKATADDPKRAKLIAMLDRHGKKHPASDEPFAAVYKEVTLYSKDRFDSGASGDCELLEQMRDRVIKPLGGVIVRDGVHCTPHQGTIGNQSMVVKILAAADRDAKDKK